MRRAVLMLLASRAAAFLRAGPPRRLAADQSERGSPRASAAATNSRNRGAYGGAAARTDDQNAQFEELGVIDGRRLHPAAWGRVRSGASFGERWQAPQAPSSAGFVYPSAPLSRWIRSRSLSAQTQEMPTTTRQQVEDEERAATAVALFGAWACGGAERSSARRPFLAPANYLDPFNAADARTLAPHYAAFVAEFADEIRSEFAAAEAFAASTKGSSDVVCKGQIGRVEAAMLYVAIRVERPQRVLEVGALCGSSTRWLLAALKANGAHAKSVSSGLWLHGFFDYDWRDTYAPCGASSRSPTARTP